jgi:hypothetical protein
MKSIGEVRALLASVGASVARLGAGGATAAALLVALCVPAQADGKIDRSIDAAAAKIVAARIGDIRGGFAPGDEPVFVTVQDPSVTASVPVRPGVWIDGLALAHDPLARPGERYGL